MLTTSHFALEDPHEVRRLIERNPWATFVSSTTHGLVASHYPVILDTTTTGDELVLVSHFGRPDDEYHDLGDHEILVIVQGPHDYVSPSWYREGDVVPTWNHITAHLYGTPEVLSDDENYHMLVALTEKFEHHRPDSRHILDDEEGTRRMARGTVGLRLRVDRFIARAKLSQNKTPDVVQTVIDNVESSNPRLAAEMRRAHRHDGHSRD